MKNDSSISDLVRGFLTAAAITGVSVFYLLHPTALTDDIELAKKNIKNRVESRIGKYSAKSTPSESVFSLKELVEQDMYRFDSIRQPRHVIRPEYSIRQSANEDASMQNLPAIYTPGFYD